MAVAYPLFEQRVIPFLELNGAYVVKADPALKHRGQLYLSLVVGIQFPLTASRAFEWGSRRAQGGLLRGVRPWRVQEGKAVASAIRRDRERFAGRPSAGTCPTAWRSKGRGIVRGAAVFPIVAVEAQDRCRIRG